MFNEKNAPIIQCAKIITELCLKFIDNHDDPETIMMMYNDMPPFRNLRSRRPTTGNSQTDEDELYSDEPCTCSLPRRTRSKPPVNWLKYCQTVLNEMINSDDAEPFLEAIDENVYPDYGAIIHTPMNLLLVKEKIENAQYSSALEFTQDIRLIFTNSKKYNTKKKSRI